jgi:hypothetical protein
MKTAVVFALFGLFAAQAADLSKPFVPNVPDLTIRLRFTTEAAGAIESDSSRTLYFKGARQRQEDVIERGVFIGGPNGQPRHGTIITQCDEHRTVQLHDEAMTYAYRPTYDPSDYFRRARQPPSPAMPIRATTTTNSVDTGERRPIGPYVARHVVTTTRTEFRPNGESRVEERDGWYVDLPVDCHDWAARLELYDTTPGAPGGQMILRGNGHRGFPIIETLRIPNGRSEWREGQTTNVTVTMKTELVHVSDEVLDAALFTVPPDYRPALPRPRGGHDMSKPDTLVNRAALYWQELVAWANHMFR